MCTMTWLFTDEGYTVFFNRDEAKTRAPSEWPQIRQQNGVRLISPKETDGGGTLMGVNEFGVTCCLLDNYNAQPPAINGRPISLSGVRVTAQKIEFFYISGAPCQTGDSSTVVLHRTWRNAASRSREALARLHKSQNQQFVFRRFPDR